MIHVYHVVFMKGECMTVIDLQAICNELVAHGHGGYDVVIGLNDVWQQKDLIVNYDLVYTNNVNVGSLVLKPKNQLGFWMIEHELG